jgi:hypothetical protein
MRAARVTRGSHVVAFVAGVRGPVAVVRGPGARTLSVVRRGGGKWRTTWLARVPAGSELGWPGLALDRGLPVVAYTRWRRSTRKSDLELARVDRRGRVHSTRITRAGFPKSYVPPPAVPVLVGGDMHVIESYGDAGAVGTIEWHPDQREGWSGQVIDGGIGDFPVGPVFAVMGAGTLYAAWSSALLGTGELPVTLAVRGRSIDANYLLDRAITTGLEVTRFGPEVAANEWVGADEIGLAGGANTWAGIVVTRSGTSELDGWLAGLASAPRSARDLLLARPDGLSWYRLPRRPTMQMTIDATQEPDGSVLVTGLAPGVSSGSVTLYRERPGSRRESAGRASIARDGSFTFVDRPTRRPFLYRAVFRDGATGLPYSALLRDVVD